MEIRILRYFLEIAREGSMTRAAERLHISQPTLSKQMKELERELGRKLFIRSNYSVKLSDEGVLLRKRAEDILDMVDKTEEEFRSLSDIAGGDLYIGCAESYLMKYFAHAVQSLRESYPGIRYHFISGGTEQVTERLDKGLLDFAVIVEAPDLSKYNSIELPETNTWVALMKRDEPLAEKKSVRFDDLLGHAVFCSEQSVASDLPRWCGERVDQLGIKATFNLANNAAVFVRQGLGLALVLDKLVYTGSDNDLCCRPLEPPLETKMYIIWRKYQVFSPAAELLLHALTDVIDGEAQK